MELISKKSILIIAPSLIAESLSLKLTSLDQNLEINFNNGTGDKTPDLVIWNVLNFQSEDLIRLELLKLRERYDGSKFLIILSGELIYEAKNVLSKDRLNDFDINRNYYAWNFIKIDLRLVFAVIVS